jgi:PTH1 family peptidyl-tRNA hydrolase
MQLKPLKLKLKWKMPNLKSSSPLLFVGLGNPGSEYHETRHNVGFRVLDRLAERWGITFRKPFFQPYEKAVFNDPASPVVLIKPLTFMNRSGMVIPGLLSHWHVEPDHLFIITDNMDLPPGEIRIKRKGSSGGHNGLSSVTSALGHGEFNRIYLGVGRPGDPAEVVDHVLGIPSPEEAIGMEEAEKRACDALAGLLTQPLDRIINEYNRRNPL